ncbi:MAG TPA: ATP-binding protein [Egibacteraceae bacterium]|jgi:two-component system, OmpR family, sensor kinase|nr:ATP-binding protein [Egibacteraceae bacterium]
MTTAPEAFPPPRRQRIPTPDDVLLRRFGLVRAVGGAAYFIAVGVLFGIFGSEVWPLALGVPVLAVVTTAYFKKSVAYPRTAVIASLLADALVLGGAVAFLGGTGSGLIMLYTIVVVSAGILLGPKAAYAFTVFTCLLAVLQLGLEELGLHPALLHRPDLGERVVILLVSIAGVISVGYLSATYASRLHELIALAGEEAETVRERNRRRRSFVRQASVDVRSPLRELEEVADQLDDSAAILPEKDRRRLAARLRVIVTKLDAEVAQLTDVGVLDETSVRLEPVVLRRVVEDSVVALGRRLDHHTVNIDVGPVKVVADGRGARRIVFNLLENVADHTPSGTTVTVTALTTAGHGVLVVTDDGPGVPSTAAHRLFDPPDEGGGPRVGLPLVAELAEAMGARVRYEPAPRGGARFLVSFRLSPSAAPSADDEPTAADRPRAAKR